MQSLHLLPARGGGTLRATLLTGALALVAAVLVWALVWAEIHRDPGPVDWTVFAGFAVALLVCERQPRTWIRFGPVGVVTPLWMFGFGLLLLGSPILAVGVGLAGTTIHAIAHDASIAAMTHRVAGTAISLASAGLLLFAMGVDGSITHLERVPWGWAATIVVAGLAILFLNTVVAALTLGIHRRISFVSLLRRGLAVRLTAEGAMLSLAPIWVIAIDFSPVLVPMLAITTVLVFRATREALERSHEAVHDSLTGLLNRRGFFDHFEGVLSDPRTLHRASVVVMDLDGFKDVNDRLGHQMGDALLVAFALRLERHLPSGAVAARLGGDEFAVLLMGDAEDDPAELVAELHVRLSAPLDVGGFPVTVGVSVGVATAPLDGTHATDLLRSADLAMYQAKHSGAAIERYRDARPTSSVRPDLLGDLTDAVDRGQFLVSFQPQVRIADGRVDTVEALVRWNHPVHGVIGPAEFVGLAEQTDLIGRITETVLRLATRALITAGVRDVHLAVNVSARSLHEPAFVDDLLAFFRQTGFPPGRLELEVAERALAANPERARPSIERLREAGVRVALDDFGVGSSSFQTLRSLDVDRLKIDRSFVQGLLTEPRDGLIIASVVGLAHDLGLDVVAEGVESPALWDAVAALGCDGAQGYGIAVPMAFPELRGWMSSRAVARGSAPGSVPIAM